MRINHLINRQSNLGGSSHTHTHTHIMDMQTDHNRAKIVCTGFGVCHGLSSVGAQEKKAEVLRLFHWLWHKVTVQCQEKDFNPVAKKLCLIYVFFAMFFFRATVIVMYQYDCYIQCHYTFKSF